MNLKITLVLVLVAILCIDLGNSIWGRRRTWGRRRRRRNWGRRRRRWGDNHLQADENRESSQGFDDSLDKNEWAERNQDEHRDLDENDIEEIAKNIGEMQDVGNQ